MKAPTFLKHAPADSPAGAAPVPAAIREARSAAVRALRERGVTGARLYPLRWSGPMLREAAGGDRVRVLVAREGLGSCGFYDHSFVESALPLVAAGVDCFLDHATAAEDAEIPERRVDQKCGWLSEAAMTSVDGKPAVVATLNPRVGDARILSLIQTARQKAAAYPDAPPFFAMSYAGYGAGATGTTPDGEAAEIVSKMTDLLSVDVVTASHIGKPLFGSATESAQPHRVRISLAKYFARVLPPNYIRGATAPASEARRPIVIPQPSGIAPNFLRPQK